MKIQDDELKEICGGAVKFGIVAAIAAGITFIIGIIDGQIKLK